MKLHFYPSHLQFIHPFVLSVGTRSSTPVVFIELTEGGFTGYGEATLPPYLAENQDSVISFLKALDISKISLDEDPSVTMNGICEHYEGNNAAKAAFDIALHDLYGKFHQKSMVEYFNPEHLPLPQGTFTIAVREAKDLPAKISEGNHFPVFKVKLGAADDKSIIKMLVANTDKKFCVDVNQGWKDKIMALEMIHWLAEQGCLLVEQPLPKTMKEESAFIKEKSKLAVYADEAVRTVEDLHDAEHLYHGVNIKLMKCGGLHMASQMIKICNKKQLKMLFGCMSESSCGVTAAAHIAHHGVLADLDGPWLINNDPFAGISIENGRIKIPGKEGLSISKK